MNKKTQKQMLLEDIAVALSDYMAADTGSAHFVDLTTGGVTFIQCEYMIEDITPEELASYRDWEQHSIREYMEHDLVMIDTVPNYESFQVMEAFAESRSQSEQSVLYAALRKRSPFRRFRTEVESMGLLQEWYDFKNAADQKRAEEWLKENELEIENGKIVRVNKH